MVVYGKQCLYYLYTYILAIIFIDNTYLNHVVKAKEYLTCGLFCGSQHRLIPKCPYHAREQYAFHRKRSRGCEKLSVGNRNIIS